jgi:hypothetical protein
MITNTRKKSVLAAVGAAAAAAAIPAILFAGAGTAQAETFVSPISDAFGVTVFVGSNAWDPSSGWCTYTAVPNGPGVPVYGLPFYLQEGATHKLWFPGIQTGTTWNVTVDCPNGTDSPTQQVVY